jgi:hypothetical protein
MLPPASWFKIRHTRNQHEAGSKFGSFFNLEDCGDMFPSNVGCLSTDYVALQNSSVMKIAVVHSNRLPVS